MWTMRALLLLGASLIAGGASYFLTFFGMRHLRGVIFMGVFAVSGFYAQVYILPILTRVSSLSLPSPLKSNPKNTLALIALARTTYCGNVDEETPMTENPTFTSESLDALLHQFMEQAQGLGNPGVGEEGLHIGRDQICALLRGLPLTFLPSAPP